MPTPAPQRRNRLLYAYVALAVCELVTVAGALYLTHRLTYLFDQSVSINKAWQQRLRAYSLLDDRAADVAAPVKDLFVTGVRAAQEERFSRALAIFDRETAAARQEALQGIEPALRTQMINDLDAIVATRDSAVRELRAILETFRQDTPQVAANAMSSADAAVERWNATIARLQDDAIANEGVRLNGQERVADSIRAYETAMGLAIVLMVIAAAFYGRHISIRMQKDASEREDHIAQLGASAAALRQTEERLQLAARATNDALWDWEVATGRVWWNSAFAERFAQDGLAPTLDGWKGLIHPDDRPRIERSLRQFLDSTSEVWNEEYRMRRSSGTYAWILDRGYTIRAGKTPRRMISSLMDITERKEAERMKSDFVSFVSHQLRTPLSGMNWMLELAADADGLPDDVRAHISDARESAARLATLVNDLLDIAKLESGRLSAVPEALALSTVTESVIAELKSLATDKALVLGLTSEPSVAPVFADAQLLRQVITNLLSNAVKYTPHLGRVAVHLCQQNGSVTWSVRDTGVGVPRDAQPRLFEKFYRAENAIMMDAEGTGLGLHLVRLIVEQAGGRVWCESEEGQGATFAFTLPAMTAREGRL
jgi:PAS domain S-box-containing protein